MSRRSTNGFSFSNMASGWNKEWENGIWSAWLRIPLNTWYKKSVHLNEVDA